MEQHQVSVRLAEPPSADGIAAARSAVLAGGLVVEPRSLRLDASPSVALSLGKLTLRRPAVPPTATATSGVLIWKFRTTEPGVYAVRPAMGMFIRGSVGSDVEVVTVTRRAVRTGRRANAARTGAAAPRLKLSSVVLGLGCIQLPAGAPNRSSTIEISDMWKKVAETPLLKASTVHQYVDIQLTTPAIIARDRGEAAIRSEAPIDGQHGTSRSRAAPVLRSRLSVDTQSTDSPVREQQSAEEWAVEIHQKAKSVQAVPEYFLDPILGRIFVDPVTTEVGNTYERASIERWLASGKRTDPLTNAVLEDTRLVPNNLLRSQIQAWRAAAPGAGSNSSGAQICSESNSSSSSSSSSSRAITQQIAQRAADAADLRAAASVEGRQQLPREGAVPSAHDDFTESRTCTTGGSVSQSYVPREDKACTAERRPVLSECTINQSG